jgi:hypothetical protein
MEKKVQVYFVVGKMKRSENDVFPSLSKGHQAWNLLKVTKH